MYFVLAFEDGTNKKKMLKICLSVKAIAVHASSQLLSVITCNIFNQTGR